MVSLGSFTYFATTTTCFFHSENLTQPNIKHIKIILKYDFEKCVTYLHNSRGN